MGAIREDDFCRLELDEDGQGTATVKGHGTVHAYWACAYCGKATGGSAMACPDHPYSIRFLKHDHIPGAGE